MPLPLALHAKFLARFDELIKAGDDLRWNDERRESSLARVQWLAQVSNLLKSLLREHAQPHVDAIVALKEGNLHYEYLTMGERLAYVKGLRDDFDKGFLEDIAPEIERAVAADYMGQAERLLDEGQPGHFDHVPAAVLTGAVLEKHLRAMCALKGIAVVKQNGEPLTMNPIIDELKKATAFNETVAKQLRAWAGIRNHAAHGEFDQFNRQQVQAMIDGVKQFMGTNLI